MSTVLYANANVVSIWTNPTSNIGDNTPLYDPRNNINRLVYDSRLDYLNIIYIANFTISLGYRENPGFTSGKKFPDLVFTETINVATHNLGYTPSFILLDRETRQSVTGNTFSINSDASSFRVFSALTDSNFYYLKIRYFVGKNPLLAETKRFTIYGFNNPSTVGS